MIWQVEGWFFMHWLNLSEFILHGYSINDQALYFMWIRTIGINCLLFEKLRIAGYVKFVMFFSMLNHWWVRDLCELGLMLTSWLIFVMLEDKHVISVGEFDNVHIWLIFQLYLLVFWADLWKTEWNLLVFIHNGQVMARKGKLEDFERFLSDFEAEDLVSRFIIHLTVWRFADSESES